MQARVAAALEHLDAPAALGEQGGEQGAGEAGADDGEGFRVNVTQVGNPTSSFPRRRESMLGDCPTISGHRSFQRGFSSWINRSFQLRFHFLIRSEEHTSELQSLMRISYAVFCLKKKNTIIIINIKE